MVTTTAELFLAKLHPESRSRPSGHTGPGGIHLSEAGSCQRKQTLRILGYRAEAPSDGQQAIFNAGVVWEDYIGRLWAEKYPRQIRRQIPVPTPYGTGYLDLWIAPEKKLIEVKTTRSHRWGFLPLSEHVAQVQLYLHFWGIAHEATAELAYVLKESGEILSIPVIYDAALAAQLEGNLQRVQDALGQKEVLPIPAGYVPGRFPCGWTGGRCAFWEHCWGATKAEPTGQLVPET